MTKKKLLIIEDATICMETFNFIIDRNKYEILHAKDGEEGLRKASSFKPDLIFLDIMLPKINGYKVAKAIRSKPALGSIPIIAISAWVGRVGEKMAFEAGCEEFIHKPFQIPKIQEVLTRFLG